MKGTLLNAGTVAAGSLLGLAVGRVLPPSLEPVAIGALGLVTVGIGLKMFLAARNPVIVAGALVVGGILGTLLGITPGLESLGTWLKGAVGGGGRSSRGSSPRPCSSASDR